jgi:hypothetical protein
MMRGKASGYLCPECKAWKRSEDCKETLVLAALNVVKPALECPDCGRRWEVGTVEERGCLLIWN